MLNNSGKGGEPIEIRWVETILDSRVEETEEIPSTLVENGDLEGREHDAGMWAWTAHQLVRLVRSIIMELFVKVPASMTKRRANVRYLSQADAGRSLAWGR